MKLILLKSNFTENFLQESANGYFAKNRNSSPHIWKQNNCEFKFLKNIFKSVTEF